MILEHKHIEKGKFIFSATTAVTALHLLHQTDQRFWDDLRGFSLGNSNCTFPLTSVVFETVAATKLLRQKS